MNSLRIKKEHKGSLNDMLETFMMERIRQKSSRMLWTLYN